jgi:hypothetical protein
MLNMFNGCRLASSTGSQSKDPTRRSTRAVKLLLLLLLLLSAVCHAYVCVHEPCQYGSNEVQDDVQAAVPAHKD